MFFLVQPERHVHVVICHVYVHLWNGKTQSNKTFIYYLFIYISFLTKPPSSTILTQATVEILAFIYLPPHNSQIFQLSM